MLLKKYIIFLLSIFIYSSCTKSTNHKTDNIFEFRIFTANHKWDLKVRKNGDDYYFLATNPNESDKYTISNNGEAFYENRRVGLLKKSVPYFGYKSLLGELSEKINVKDFLVEVDFGHRPNISLGKHAFIKQLIIIDKRKK